MRGNGVVNLTLATLDFIDLPILTDSHAWEWSSQLQISGTGFH